MFPLIAAIFLALVPSLTVAQGPTPLEWAPDELYNPMADPKGCGLRPADEGYICDPNRILGEHVHSINWVLKDAAYNSTRCPCSNYYCETHKRPTGFRIGVALVRRMKIQTSVDGRRNTPADQAQLFAYKLESSKWAMGECEEDIIIFYSLEDKVLAIYGGSTAMMHLTPYYRDLLVYRVGDHFNEGRIVEALNNLLYDLKIILNCENPLEYDCGLHQIRSGVSSVAISMSLIVPAVLVAVYNYFSI